MPGEPSPLVSGADIRTFLFADMRGYTRFTQEHGDDDASALAGRFADLVKETMPGFEGELLELRGDEALCVFRSARQALRASVELQRRLRTATDEEAAFPIGVGMGLDAGEAVPTRGGYRGDALNVAARLCAVAKGGEVLASESLTQLARSVEGIRFSSPRSRVLKGIERPVRVVEIIPEIPLAPAPLPPRGPDRRRRRLLWATGPIVLVTVLAIAAFTSRSHPGGRSGPTVHVRANSVALIDRAGDRIVADVPVGQVPDAVAIGLGYVWVANSGDNTLSRIDPKSRAVTATVNLPGRPIAIGVGSGYVWAFDNATGWVFQVSSNGSLVAKYRLEACAPSGVSRGCTWARIAVGFGRVWVDDGLSTVYAMNPSNGRFDKVIATVPAWALAIGNGNVYSANDVQVASIAPGPDPFAQGVQNALSNPGGGGPYPLSIVAAQNSIWGASQLGSVFRLDSSLAPVHDVNRHPGDDAIAFGANAVWVTNLQTHALLKLDAAKLGLQRTVPFGRLAPAGVAFGENHAWVTMGTPNQLPANK